MQYNLFKNFKITGYRITCLLIIFSSTAAYCQDTKSGIVNIIFTADPHYGLTRAEFKGHKNVASYIVNAAMIANINAVPSLTLPADSGAGAGNKVGAVDYLIEGGDIANRMEDQIQTATASWAQFKKDYIHDLKLIGSNGKPAELLLMPGNHDISNAIGFVRPMEPETDPTSMVNIYNLMMKPEKPVTNDSYDYSKDKINYSLDIKGIHFVFVNLWPDSAERIWIEKDLRKVNNTTPVILFTHDEPVCQAKHFTNPVPPHLMGEKRKFQNLLDENYKEGRKAHKGEENTVIEQRGFVNFLKLHPNIIAYFHGNTNYNEFYDYKGPDNDINLKTFRVDSPMKGEYSAKNEKLLSFQLISINTVSHLLTVRECLWNTDPLSSNNVLKFGKTATISLQVN